MDPIVIGDPLTDKIKEEVKASLSDLPYILNIHDFRIVKGPTHINIVFDVIVSQDKALNLEEVSKEIDSRIHSLSENPMLPDSSPIFRQQWKTSGFLRFRLFHQHSNIDNSEEKSIV